MAESCDGVHPVGSCVWCGCTYRSTRDAMNHRCAAMQEEAEDGGHRLAADAIREAIHLRPAFMLLVGHTCPRNTDPDAVPLQVILDGVATMGRDRAASLLHAFHSGETWDEARALLAELEAKLETGHRPRTISAILGPWGGER